MGCGKLLHGLMFSIYPARHLMPYRVTLTAQGNKGINMKTAAKLLSVAAVGSVLALPMFPTSAEALGRYDPVRHSGYRGAPGPIAGAGLPILAIAFGAVWLVRRYRRKQD